MIRHVCPKGLVTLTGTDEPRRRSGSPWGAEWELCYFLTTWLSAQPGERRRTKPIDVDEHLCAQLPSAREDEGKLHLERNGLHISRQLPPFLDRTSQPSLGLGQGHILDELAGVVV